jgi:very-short-patch-repair endonuclease
MFECSAGSSANELAADVLGPPGQVRVVFAPNIADVLDEARAWCGARSPVRRMIVDRVPAVTGLDALIDHFLVNLADVARALWPAWYGGTVVLPDGRLPPSEFKRQFGEALAACKAPCRDVMPSWTWRASSLCRRGKPPRPRGFTPAVEAAQLARAIDPDDLLVVVGIESVQPAHLFGLARAVEWFAQATAARLLVVIPQGAATADALDPINFQAIHWRASSDTPSDQQAPIPEESTERVWPTVGTPHPFSPGEQLLAMRLQGDAELAGLFGYNMAVRSRFGRLFLADLLWEAGRLIVEVDGYGHHSDRRAFAADRQRDYELSASGYLTLRMPHDEVMSDSERALEKIRNLVRLRQSQTGFQDKR